METSFMYNKKQLIFLVTVSYLLLACNPVEYKQKGKVVKVDPSHFITDNLLAEIEEKVVKLDGIETDCYVIKSRSRAVEHPMGPWCPTHLSDGADKGGIWFKDGKVYDVTGEFIAHLDKFYNDEEWKLYREDSSINVTNTLEGCLGAAKPNVEKAYQNHCVECLPEYFEDQSTTFIIPISPVYASRPSSSRHKALGLAFNGVKFDPPAPENAILSAHTLAPLDDHGGHVNPHGGYHYHAVTGSIKEIKQEDGHAPMIGYALDGFGIYAELDEEGKPSEDLDECGGHFDELRGYHYHAGPAGGNQIIKCLHGLVGEQISKE